MKSNFGEALSYIELALRTYVGARKFIDKLFSSQLVVVSMIMATDALLLKHQLDFPKLVAPDSNPGFSDVRIDAYRERVNDLKNLEETIDLGLCDVCLTKMLEDAVNVLEKIYTQGNIAVLLNLNFKQFLNTAQTYILAIQTIINKN